MKFIEILFWLSLIIVFYTYLGYGMVLYLMVKIKELFLKPKEKELPKTENLPEVTLFITAYNEEAIVKEKMDNCRGLDYPKDKLKIVWVTDGSSDSTNELLKAYPEGYCFVSTGTTGKDGCTEPGNGVCLLSYCGVHGC